MKLCLPVVIPDAAIRRNMIIICKQIKLISKYSIITTPTQKNDSVYFAVRYFRRVLTTGIVACRTNHSKTNSNSEKTLSLKTIRINFDFSR